MGAIFGKTITIGASDVEASTVSDVPAVLRGQPIAAIAARSACTVAVQYAAGGPTHLLSFGGAGAGVEGQIFKILGTGSGSTGGAVLDIYWGASPILGAAAEALGGGTTLADIEVELIGQGTTLDAISATLTTIESEVDDVEGLLTSIDGKSHKANDARAVHRTSAALTSSFVAPTAITIPSGADRITFYITYTRSAGVAGYAQHQIQLGNGTETAAACLIDGSLSISGTDAARRMYFDLLEGPHPASDSAITYPIEWRFDGASTTVALASKEASGLAAGTCQVTYMIGYRS